MHLPVIISPGPQGRLQRKLLLARLAMFLERLWHALLRPLMLAGLMLLLAASGALAALPDALRLLAWIGFIAALAWLLRDLRGLRLPGREEALARLEAQSGLAHQPLRTLQDEIMTPRADDAARALWQAHRERIAGHIENLRAGWPRSDAPRRDPFALRFALALALVATLALQGGRVPDNLRASLRLPMPGLPADAAPRLDAWIDPPSFVRAPPLMLAVNGRLLHAGETVRTVQGARLIVRHAGARAPRLQLLAPETGSVLREEPLAQVAQGSWQARVKLTRPVRVRLRGGGVDAVWRIEVMADAPPSVRLVKPPAATVSGALALHWQAQDDHGVRAVRVEIELAQPVAGMLRYDAPSQPLAVSRPGRSVQGRDLLKLMAHPWAGLPVRLRLVATDVAGQQGRSPEVRLKLPQRPFRQPLARAIIEQRRELVLHPARRGEVAEVLAALLAWPAGLLQAKESSAYLGLRHALTALLDAEDEDDVKAVVALLWEIAEAIEDGDLADARRQLQAARRALQEALRNGASEEEIARRVAELKQALERFLQMLAQRGLARETARPGEGMRSIRPQDLARMMEQIERMARSGARDAAQRLLSQLDDILQNLQLAPSVAAPPTPQQRALGKLQELMREQQKLLDETWREAQRRRREGRDFDPGERSAALQRRQQALAETLRQLLEGLRPPSGRGNGENAPSGNSSGAKAGDDPGNSLRRAERAMRDAARRLGRGQPGGAMGQQMQALQALRQGARRLARQIARQQGRQPGGAGIGFMRPRHDPLGRPLRGRFMDPGPGRQMVPEADAMERARRILEYLRRQAEDATRPPLERNYIERLLRGLY